jgi:uncharacterized protein (DUF1330 family)
VSYLSVYTQLQLLEGEPIRGAVLVEFKSSEIAKTWYESDAYQRIRPLRLKGARGLAFIIDGGVAAPDTWLL